MLGDLLLVVLLAQTVVMERVVRWLFALIWPLLADLDFVEQLSEAFSRLTVPTEGQETAAIEGGPANETALLLMRAAFALVILVAVLAIVYVLVARRRARPRPDEAEQVDAEQITLGGGALRRGWQRLRKLAGLVRRYGLGRELLDAISVENLYANLCRIARQRGQERHPTEPPDEYLPRLMLAFPGHDEGLATITEAYMRVYYGEQALGGAELENLKREYERIREGPQ